MDQKNIEGFKEGFFSRCPECKCDAIYPDGYCGNCRQTTIIVPEKEITCSDVVAKVQPIRNDDLESAAGFMEKMEGITTDFTNVLERNLRLEEKVKRLIQLGNPMASMLSNNNDVYDNDIAEAWTNEAEAK